MLSSLRNFGRQHPCVRDAVLWSLPAILFGAWLRWLLLSYQPYAYWGSDSQSYYMFAERIFSWERIDLQEKRRFLYPILMVPVTLLPGAPLRNLAWLQHAGGLLMLISLAYVARRVFVCWRWLIPPITTAAAAIPVTIWYEHELLGENVFFAGVTCACAGWVAWTTQCDRLRARRLWWWFFAGLAMIVLMKPAGRFFWPGVLLALVAVRAWRVMIWPQAASLAAIAGLGTMMGSEGMAAWLLYSTAFPLTRLETPLHAEYKAEARDLVTKARKEIDAWYLVDFDLKMWLKRTEDDPSRPHWAELGMKGKDKLRTRVYRDLALEGIRARPDLFFYIAVQRIVGSSPLTVFKDSRFDATYFPKMFQRHYEEFSASRPGMIYRIFALPKDRPLPTAAEFMPTLTRHGTWEERWFKNAMDRVCRILSIAREPLHLPEAQRSIGTFRVEPFGWLLFAGSLLSALPRYRRTLGLWLIIAGGYLFGVFLVGSMNPRFFGAVWGPLFLLAAVPLDVVLSAVTGKCRNVLRTMDGPP
jgi:hypothetical protein